MLQDRCSLWLAVGVTCLSFSFDHSYSWAARVEGNSQVGNNYLSFYLAQGNNAHRDQESKLTAEGFNYEALMAAGYKADQNRDYLTALKYFKQALRLRPEDSFAARAIINITSYAFDRYMQAGYSADRNQDYQTALANFQKAREIRPDSVYAETAIRNMTNYLTADAQLVSQEQTEPSPSRDNQNLLLMVIGLIITVMVGSAVLLLLLKKSDDPSEEPVEENLNSDPVASPKTTVEINSATVKSDPDKYKVEVEPDLEPTPNPVATNANPTPNQVAQQPSMLVTPSSSISKLDIVPELIDDLQSSDRAIRRKTIWELAQRADSRAMKPLVELMLNVDSQERSLILEAMTQIASRTLKPMNQALTLSLEDQNSQVRQNAIRDLTRVYELMGQVTKRLSQAVEDSDSQVQETAKWALQQLNQMPQVPWEVQQMGDNKNSSNQT